MDMKSLMPLLMGMNSGNQSGDSMQNIMSMMNSMSGSSESENGGNNEMMQMLPLLMNMMNNNSSNPPPTQSTPPPDTQIKKTYERFSPIENFSGKEINLGLYNLMKNT